MEFIYDDKRICKKTILFIKSITLLFHFIHSINILKDTNLYYIITPQITPMWDNSWDPIVNNEFKNDGIHFQSRDPYKHFQCLSNDVMIKPIDGFKFGGGWATVISTQLAKKIGIPESLGHYGLEDTFIMYCSYMMQQKGLGVTQYVLENEIIVEDHLYRFNPYKEFLTVINKQEEFKKIAHESFQKELIKFENSLNN